VQDALLRQRFGRARLSRRERLAAWCTAVGITTVVITVIVCVTNAISAQQAIAMALSAGVTALSGLLGLIVPDAWTAWRRGFRQGCEAAMRCQSDSLGTDSTDNTTDTKTRREQSKRSG
jgi:uncharacterized membrane protein